MAGTFPSTPFHLIAATLLSNSSHLLSLRLLVSCFLSFAIPIHTLYYLIASLSNRSESGPYQYDSCITLFNSISYNFVSNPVLLHWNPFLSVSWTLNSLLFSSFPFPLESIQIWSDPLSMLFTLYNSIAIEFGWCLI
jgi:hypothetical protein